MPSGFASPATPRTVSTHTHTSAQLPSKPISARHAYAHTRPASAQPAITSRHIARLLELAFTFATSASLDPLSQSALLARSVAVLAVVAGTACGARAWAGFSGSGQQSTQLDDRAAGSGEQQATTTIAMLSYYSNVSHLEMRASRDNCISVYCIPICCISVYCISAYSYLGIQ